MKGEGLGVRENIHMNKVWRLKMVNFGRMWDRDRFGDHQQMDK